MPDVLKHIRRLKPRCDHLLIEGSGGLLVPLGEGYTVADLIAKLRCKIVVVASNRLGTINHTLLTIRALQAAGHEQLKVVLTNSVPTRRATPDNPHNAGILAELLAPVPLFTLPFLGPNPANPRVMRNHAEKLKTTLVGITS